MRLPGIGGSLFPGHFLATRFAHQALTSSDRAEILSQKRHFAGWWKRVESSCGPATGLRTLFDLVAMPLAGLLGFRARDAEFEDDVVRVTLSGPGPYVVPLLLLHWAARPSHRSRDLFTSRPVPSEWCFVLSPPFLTLVSARGHAFRRSADFRLPDSLDDRSFAAFWTLCRASSLVTPAGAQIIQEAFRFQDGVRRDLQAGVMEALGLIAPVVGETRRTTSDGRLAEALTLVYRTLFLLFAESRSVGPIQHPRFHQTYTVTALCREAARSGARAGIWEGLAAITRLSRSGCDTSDLIVRPFNGRLFSRSAAPALEATGSARSTRQSTKRDVALSNALVSLATRRGAGGREDISYVDLGVEQLGAVYERVLDIDPDTLIGGTTRPDPIELRRHSRRRKESGTFYTPQSLAEFVIRRTLGPLVTGRSADEILELRVVDPAMGSGAFLVAACRFLANAYERALVDEGRIAETDLHADSRAGIRRLIASRCLSGVDVNPVAVQLARLSLWLTTVARDKPLSFFDHQLRCGNSLIGATPDDLWRVRDRQRTGQGMPLFEGAGLDTAMRAVSNPWRQLRSGADDTIQDVRSRERLWNSIESGQSPLAPWRHACDLWCSRWFWDGMTREAGPSELRAALDAILRNDTSLGRKRIDELSAVARKASRAHGFFHWPLEFADLFYDREGAPRARPGFDAVIGNPPWEMLRGGDPRRHRLVSFVRGSGLYPSCDRGHVNLYQPFLERSLSLVRQGGRVGLVLPWGLASDDGAAALRRRLLQTNRIDTVVGLDNGAGLFPIHRGLRFMVMVVERGSERRSIQARFGVRTSAELDELPGVADPEASCPFPVHLDANLLSDVGGGTLRIPDLRHADDLPWLASACRRYSALGSGWKLSFGRELNATEDRECFGTRGLPVIDGKHIAPFRVNLAETTSRLAEPQARRLLPSGAYLRPRLAYRDVSGVGNRLTLIAAIIPAGAVTTHTLFCLREPLPAEQQHFLCALFNSASLNRIVRLLMGSHVTTGLVEHLPVPAWTGTRDQIRLAELGERMAGLPASAEGDATAVQREIDARVGRLYNSPRWPTTGSR